MECIVYFIISRIFIRFHMIALNIQGVFLKKNMGKMGYFFFGVIIPPITVRIASINPASGIPIC